jgi:hypothetical protein
MLSFALGTVFGCFLNVLAISLCRIAGRDECDECKDGRVVFDRR